MIGFSLYMSVRCRSYSGMTAQIFEHEPNDTSDEEPEKEAI